MKHDHKFGSQDAKDTVLHGRLIDDIDVSATHFLKETKGRLISNFQQKTTSSDDWNGAATM